MRRLDIDSVWILGSELEGSFSPCYGACKSDSHKAQIVREAPGSARTENDGNLFKEYNTNNESIDYSIIITSAYHQESEHSGVWSEHANLFLDETEQGVGEEVCLMGTPA